MPAALHTPVEELDVASDPLVGRRKSSVNRHSTATTEGRPTSFTGFNAGVVLLQQAVEPGCAVPRPGVDAETSECATPPREAPLSACRPPEKLPILYFRQWDHTIPGVSGVKLTEVRQGRSQPGPTERLDVDPAKLTLVTYPHPALRKACGPVADFDDKLAQIAACLLAVMHEHKGVGLAGPQVGLSLRLFVCNSSGEPDDDQVYVNPELSDFEGLLESDEGCLSIPEVNVIMRRARSVTLRAQTVTGEPVRKHAEGLLARIWQHETDHLDGKLIIDHMSEVDRMDNRRALKQLEKDYAKRGRRPR